MSKASKYKIPTMYMAFYRDSMLFNTESAMVSIRYITELFQKLENGEILIDQGGADPFLMNQLKPELFEAACMQANVPLDFRLHEQYDHGYYFVASFIEDHLRFHAKKLAG